MEHITYKLKNKATVIEIPLMDTKSLTTLVMYPVGSRYEPEKLSGVSHYIEHLMFKGTKKRKTSFILTREIDRLGAEYNAFTGKEYTGYYIKADAAHTKVSFDILSDMLFHSVFDRKEMEREKPVIVEELRMYKDNPIMNIDNIFEDLMFDGCPLGRDIGGTEKHVMGYKRKDVLAFRDRYYDPSNMTIVVAGAVTKKTREQLKQYFGATPKKQTASKRFDAACFGSKVKAKRLVIDHKQTDQAQMMIGFPGFGYGHKDIAALNVLTTILGGSMSSRLFVTIREKLGLAYTVRAGSDRFRDTGYIYVRAGLDPKNINKAIAAVKKELVKMKSKPVSKRELRDAKTHIRGALTLSLEDSSVVANWFASQHLFNTSLQTPEERLVKIEAVTEKDVQRVSKELFIDNQMRLAIIGNVEEKDITY